MLDLGEVVILMLKIYPVLLPWQAYVVLLLLFDAMLFVVCETIC
jgi:hypothetical protein